MNWKKLTKLVSVITLTLFLPLNAIYAGCPCDGDTQEEKQERRDNNPNNSY